jgi:hypothetical protein
MEVSPNEQLRTLSGDEISKFGAIKHIIIINSMINFILQPLFVIGFNFHKQGYEIQFDFKNNLPCSWVLMCKNELINKVPFNIHFTGDGNKILGICSNNFLFVNDFKYIYRFFF